MDGLEALSIRWASNLFRQVKVFYSRPKLHTVEHEDRDALGVVLRSPDRPE